MLGQLTKASPTSLARVLAGMLAGPALLASGCGGSDDAEPRRGAGGSQPGGGGAAQVSGGSATQGAGNGSGGTSSNTGGAGSAQAGANAAGTSNLPTAGTGAGVAGTGNEPGGAMCDGQVAVNKSPFGCALAWGANGNNGNRSSYLDFVTTWVGYEQNGGLGSNDCDGCGLAGTLASTNAMAVYYGYFIGYQASEDGYGDCNTDHDGENLCNHGAQWVRDNRAELIEMYASYAQKTFAASPNKPVAWLLEGDFVQYTYDDQTNKLSMAELGALARDIVCAIKSNQPNALVSIDHSAWLADDLTNAFWNAMPTDILDFIWTTGVGNNNGYINSGADSEEYNAATARYAHLHQITGLGILVDTSFGASQASDSWSGESAATLDARIAEGVIAVNVTQPPGDYQTRVAGFGGLASTCQ